MTNPRISTYNLADLIGSATGFPHVVVIYLSDTDEIRLDESEVRAMAAWLESLAHDMRREKDAWPR